MTKYSHQFPTCPVCHCPNSQELGSLLIDDGELVCSVCGVRFHRSVESIISYDDDDDESITDLQFALEEMGERSSRFMGYGLPWAVEPNLIERSYLDWIGGIDGGQYLITWPWRDVKIVPLLLSRYLGRKDGAQAIVIQEGMRNVRNAKRVVRPSCYEMMGYILQQTNDIGIDSIAGVPEEFKDGYKRFDRTDVLIKQKVVRYEVRRISKRGTVSESGLSTESIGKCGNRLIGQIVEAFGEESLRKKSEKPSGKPLKSEIINESGNIDIKLIEQEEYCAEKLNFQKKWLWEGALGLNNARYLDEVVKVLHFSEPGDLISKPLEGTRGFFIDRSCFNEEPWEVFKKLLNLQSGLVIVQDMDWFMIDADFDGERSRALLQYLKVLREERQDSAVLLFSTNRSQRYHLGIGTRRCRLNDSGVTVHTWDTPSILSQLAKKIPNDGSRYPNPLSSLWSETEEHEPPIQVLYDEYEHKDGFNEQLSKLVAGITSESPRRIVLRYFEELSRSPLFLEGDHPEPQLFRRPSDQGQPLNYDNILYTILPSSGPKSCEDFKKIVSEHYTDANVQINPLRAQLLKIIDEEKAKGNAHLTFVIHSLDVEGFTQILKDSGYGGSLSDGVIAVHGWRSAGRRIERLRLEKKRHLIVSLMPPSIHLSLRPSKESTLMFLGDKANLSRMRAIIDFRISELRSRPLRILAQSEQSPLLLKESQIPCVSKGVTNEFIVNFNDEMEIEFGGPHPTLGKQPKGLGIVTFSPGDEVILARGDGGIGILIPIKSSLMVKEGDSISEISLRSIESAKSMEDALLGKTILYDKQGLFLSFRSVFFKVMASRCPNVRFTISPYRWGGFLKMHEDSTRWNELLEACEQELAGRMGGDADGAGKELANRLVSIGLTAKNPDYVKAWWRDFDELQIEGTGSFRIYSIERPWSQSDMKRIYLEIQKILSADFDAEEAAVKNYLAVLCIQNLRESVLKRNFERFPQLEPILSDIEGLLSSIIADSEGFRIAEIENLEIIEPIQIGRIMTREEVDSLMMGGRVRISD